MAKIGGARTGGRRTGLRAALSALGLLVAPAVDADERDPARLAALPDPPPAIRLRDFNPDRPGQSHDPTTIDAGHATIEMGAFEHVFSPRGPSATTTRRYVYANPEVRAGLVDWLEMSVFGPLWTVERTSGGDGPAAARGFGDTSVGFKANVLGNDRGEHALALLPSLKLPTAPRSLGNGHAELSFAMPYNYNVDKELALTFEPSVSALRTSNNRRYRDGYGFIAGIDQRLAKVFIVSLEAAVQASTSHKEATTWSWSPSLAYFVTKNMQLDVGANFGLNKATPRYNPYLGISARF